jgi:hypothetical protein
MSIPLPSKEYRHLDSKGYLRMSKRSPVFMLKEILQEPPIGFTIKFIMVFMMGNSCSVNYKQVRATMGNVLYVAYEIT